MQDKKAGNRFALLLKDAGKAFLLGLAVAAGVFILLLAVGAVSHGFSALAGLELARRGLFIVGALALLVKSGLRPRKGRLDCPLWPLRPLRGAVLRRRGYFARGRCAGWLDVFCVRLRLCQRLSLWESWRVSA